MKVSVLTRHQILGYFLPGFMTILFIVCICFNWDFPEMIKELVVKENNYFILGIILIPISVFIGLFYDAVRDSIVEDMIELNKGRKQILWDYFTHADEEDKTITYSRYYTYYVYDINMIIGFITVIISGFLILFWHLLTEGYYYPLPFIISTGLMMGVILILRRDALNCRDAVAKKTHLWCSLNPDKCSQLTSPHEKVYTRLQASDIHGIGVFAIVDIPKGTQVFTGDENTPMVWIKKEDIQNIARPLQGLYEDFCILKDGKYGSPLNFNLMTIAWYLNNSKDPNVCSDKNYVFYASRDIKAGEELTIDYTTLEPNGN